MLYNQLLHATVLNGCACSIDIENIQGAILSKDNNTSEHKIGDTLYSRVLHWHHSMTESLVVDEVSLAAPEEFEAKFLRLFDNHARSSYDPPPLL